MPAPPRAAESRGTPVTVEALVRNEDVKVSGCGSFVLRGRPERPARNPRTGEPATVSARRVAVFSPSGKRTARMNAR